MIGGVVYLAPAGTLPPSLQFQEIGVLTAASVESWGGGPRTFHLTIDERRSPRFGPSIQEQADARLAEQLAREVPGAAGW